MATENLQIPDIQASQNQKEVTANAAHNLLDRAVNGKLSISMAAGENNLTTIQTRENFVIEATGSPGAAVQVDMPDTNQRTMALVNNTNDVITVRNSANGGTGQPVIAVGEAAIFHYDGVNFFDLTALALTVATWTGLTDTPSVYTGESGRYPQVNDAETALEFVGTAAKRNVIAATTGALTLATDIETGDIIDGVTLAEFDRVLVKDQASGEENGIYYVQTAAPPIRVEDFDDALDMQESPVLIPVLEGTANAGTIWIHTTAGAITVDTTPLTFVAALSPGAFLTLADTPSAYVNLGGQQVTVNAAENAIEFTAQHAKVPVRVATDVAGTLATSFEPTDTVDGISLAEGDRILIKDQVTGSENGIYVVAASGAPARAIDLDDNADIVLGETVPVLLGTLNAKTVWMHTAGTDIGTDTLTFITVVSTFAAGSESTPSIHPTDDPDTGIFFPAADVVAWSVGGTERMRLDITGTLFLGGTTNANMTIGLTIDMGANDDQAFVARSSDVVTGLTTLTAQDVETNDFFTISKASAVAGGALIQSMSEDATGFAPLQIKSYGGTAGVTDTTTSLGMIDLYITEHDGANGIVDVKTNGNIFAVRCRTGGVDRTRLILKDDGTLHLGVATPVVLADDKDDAMMLRAFDHMKAEQGSKGLIRSKWDEFVRYNYDDLVEAGIIGSVTSKEHDSGVQGLWNVTQHLQLLNGATWQGHVYGRETRELVEHLAGRLALAENKLAMLPAS